MVVSYNSRASLRSCVEELARADGLEVIVVDNASQDGSLESVADLPLQAIQSGGNLGFAHGCNTGWRAGSSPAVLFLNPDARIEPEAVRTLASALEQDESLGAIAPKIVEPDGSLDYSQRRFPRLGSTYARALFLQRLFPRALWADEVIRRPEDYEAPRRAEWLSGACLMVKRPVLEQLGGFDEDFFMYCEDKDLCRRIWSAGYEVAFEPAVVAVHEGGASAPRSSLLPVLAASRVRYATKHLEGGSELLERGGIGLGELTHVVVSKGGWEARAGHAKSLREVARPRH